MLSWPCWIELWSLMGKLRESLSFFLFHCRKFSWHPFPFCTLFKSISVVNFIWILFHFSRSPYLFAVRMCRKRPSVTVREELLGQVLRLGISSDYSIETEALGDFSRWRKFTQSSCRLHAWEGRTRVVLRASTMQNFITIFHVPNSATRRSPAFDKIVKFNGNFPTVLEKLFGKTWRVEIEGKHLYLWTKHKFLNEKILKRDISIQKVPFKMQNGYWTKTFVTCL